MYASNKRLYRKYVSKKKIDKGGYIYVVLLDLSSSMLSMKYRHYIEDIIPKLISESYSLNTHIYLMVINNNLISNNLFYSPYLFKKYLINLIQNLKGSSTYMNLLFKDLNKYLNYIYKVQLYSEVYLRICSDFICKNIDEILGYIRSINLISLKIYSSISYIRKISLYDSNVKKILSLLNSNIDVIN